MSRPHSVTIIAVAAIVVGLYSLVTKIFVVISPETYRLFLDFGEAMNAQALVRLPVEVHLGPLNLFTSCHPTENCLWELFCFEFTYHHQPV